MAAKHVLVCVTGQRTCEKLIRAGAELASERRCELSVLHVARTGQRFLGSEDEAAALEYLYQVSRENGADMTLTHSDDVPGAIVSFARKCEACAVVLGMPRGRGSDMGLAYILRGQLPEVELREMITSGD